MTSIRRWYQPCLADLIFVLSLLIVFRESREAMLLDDPGVGWHLRNIDAMIAQGGWLTQDPFTDRRDDRPRRWLTNQWLGELPLWIGWKWSGLEGLAFFSALPIALLARWIYLALISDGLPWGLAAAWTTIALMGTACSWSARPNLFTLLFLFLVARLLSRFHEGKANKSIFLLIPIFLLWSNIHGGFIAGLTTMIIGIGAELAISIFGNAAAWSRALHLSFVFVLCILVTLINPYGIELYRWIGLLIGDPFFMKLHQEWLPPDFSGAGAFRFALIIVAFPALMAVTARRPHLVELSVAVVWFYLALGGFRYVALWVVVAIPLLARSSAAISWVNAWLIRADVSIQPGRLFHTIRGPVPWLWSAIVAILFLGFTKLVQGQFSEHNQTMIPSRMLDRFLQRLDTWREVKGRRPVVFHGYNWGGYVTWHGWPNVLNWIDDRNEVQGRERIKEYFEIIKAAPGWREKLSQVDWACIEPNTALADTLRTDPGWKVTDEDNHAIIFSRR